MDNDLMARRLRPPSEPAQTAPSPGPIILPEYMEKETSSFNAWPPAPTSVESVSQHPAADLAEAWAPVAHHGAPADQLDVVDDDVAPESALVLDVRSPVVDAVAEFEIPATLEALDPSESVQYEAAASSQSALTDEPAADAPATYETPPWSPEARDEVPWDRPSDYEQPTDTATPEQPSWDRPEPEFWADSDLIGGPAADVFGSVVDANDEGLPFWPDTTAGQRAAVANTPRVEEAPALAAAASDPDDAHAPVLGDIAMPATRAWPEMNGHDAGRNDATVVVEAVVQTVEPARAPVDARDGWHDSLASFASWSEPQHSYEGQTPEPAPSEWVMAAIEPTELTESTPDSPPEQAPAAYADSNPDSEATTAVSDAEPDAEHEAEPAPTVAPDQMVLVRSQPLILRIELAIVDDSRLVVGAADAAWRVNDVNAVVLEVGQSDLASTPRHPAFEPRGNNGGEHAHPTHANAAAAAVPGESIWPEPTFPGASTDDAFPAATLDPPPWLDPTALAGPDPAPWDRPSDPAASASPDSFGLASVPPASTLPPPWAQSALPVQTTHWPPTDFAPSERQAETDPLTGGPTAAQASASGAPLFAPPSHLSRADTTAPRRDVAQSPFAPPAYVERELAQPAHSGTAPSAQAPAMAREQSELWFLATEPADGNAAPDSAAAAKEPSPMLTAGLTIAFAILVIVLILVFIQLMTSLLG